MNKARTMRRGMAAGCLLLALILSGCTKTPAEVREWMRDKRAPVKMAEFIQNEHFSLESKVEAVMVLLERQNSPEIPGAFGTLRTDEVNRIVARVIERMQALMDQDKAFNETKVKDAAYYLLELELSDENRAALLGYIRAWLNGSNFFLPMEKAGRVEQQRLFEVLGVESLPLFKRALETKLDELDEALVSEAVKEAELKKKGGKYKILSRPSDKITASLASTLSNLEALKMPGGNDMAAQIFLDRIEKRYPNMPRAYVLPFSSNPSEKLLGMAKRIAMDPEYRNENLNYYKDVIFMTYYRNVQKKAGAEVCAKLVEEDRTGYIRWDCLELLSIERGRDGFAALIQSIPNDVSVLQIPKDHPTFLNNENMTLWNSMRVFCMHLPATFSNQVPLEVFRQLLVKGRTVARVMSMACLSTLGTKDDVLLLKSQASDRTDLRGWGMQVSTLGELARFTGALLEKRLSVQKSAVLKAGEKKGVENNAPENAQ